MPRPMIVTRSGSLPNKAGVLLDYHAELYSNSSLSAPTTTKQKTAKCCTRSWR